LLRRAKVEYNNSGYVILGQVINWYLALNYEASLKSNIFQEKTEMKNSPFVLGNLAVIKATGLWL
jgi:hypothetical protein